MSDDGYRHGSLDDAESMLTIYRNLLVLFETNTPPSSKYFRDMRARYQPEVYRAFLEERIGYWTGQYIILKSESKP